MPKKLALTKVSAKPVRGVAPLLADVRGLILAAREQVARAVDSGLVTLYWHIGRRVHQDILKEKRAEYGAEILQTLSAKLVVEFGRGFSARNLASRVRFAEVFPDEQIVATLRRQLGWSHFLEIIYRKDELQRDFYAEMCRIERWSVRTLRQKIGSMPFSTAQKPGALPMRLVRKRRRTKFSSGSPLLRMTGGSRLSASCFPGLTQQPKPTRTT